MEEDFEDLDEEEFDGDPFLSHIGSPWHKAYENQDGEILYSGSIRFDEKLKKEYETLYKQATINKNRIALVNMKVQSILKAKPRYEAVAAKTNVPWWFIALIHQMECGGSFSKHLHNGDPLTARTTHVPKNRPSKGNPPFTWEDSAIDALLVSGENTVKDRSLAFTLYRMEGFNGFGYRQYHPDVKSPYIWSFTSVYTKGKYVADGKYDKEAVSQQIGIACYLKALKIF